MAKAKSRSKRAAGSKVKRRKRRGSRVHHKVKKDPNAPKRPLSAFFWFSKEFRSKIKSEISDGGVTEVAKELGKRWAKMDEKAKAKYVSLADKDKERYERESAGYKGKKSKVMKSKSKMRKPSKKMESEHE
ncbi:non-histone chromosomal protein 6-like [Tetranychus urticae]|uniref:HMG box domain-containing protein n=1 Tax=Tetranychus urticae TaxID=32264 RepID=T1JWH0_TETUR|nr:non-histone chromosomal protein 6-like [Tetranychus urticae]